MEVSTESLIERAVESAVVRAILPMVRSRKLLLRSIGSGALLSAVGTLFPLSAAKALAQEAKGAAEKKELRIGFLPTTCATPVLVAETMGFYEREGLRVSLVKTAAWAAVREKVSSREYDASQMPAPMPLALSLGLGTKPDLTVVASVENVDGQAITMSLRHKGRRDPRRWKGMKLAVPFEHSMQNLLLRYYVAEHGLDPDRDVLIRVVPPNEMVASLRAGSIDGYLGPEPFNQRAVHDEVGFVHTRSNDIWDGHPCCAFGIPEAFVRENPNSFAALFRAIASATAYAHKREHRTGIAQGIAPAQYLDQPVPVVEEAMAARVAGAPGRVEFDPFPRHSMAVWILTQLKRWGYLKGDVEYWQVAEKVFLATDARKRLAEMGLSSPRENYATHTIMGKAFDPSRAESYAASFAIRRC